MLLDLKLNNNIIKLKISHNEPHKPIPYFDQYNSDFAHIVQLGHSWTLIDQVSQLIKVAFVPYDIDISLTIEEKKPSRAYRNHLAYMPYDRRMLMQ